MKGQEKSKQKPAHTTHENLQLKYQKGEIELVVKEWELGKGKGVEGQGASLAKQCMTLFFGMKVKGRAIHYFILQPKDVAFFCKSGPCLTVYFTWTIQVPAAPHGLPGCWEEHPL